MTKQTTRYVVINDLNLIGWMVLKSEEQVDSKIKIFDILLKISMINYDQFPRIL